MPPTVPFLLDAKQLLSHSEPPIVQPRTWNGQQIHGEVDFRRWGIRLGSARTFSWSVLFVLLIKDSDFWGWRGNLKIYVAHIHPVAILLAIARVCSDQIAKQINLHFFIVSTTSSLKFELLARSLIVLVGLRNSQAKPRQVLRKWKYL